MIINKLISKIKDTLSLSNRKRRINPVMRQKLTNTDFSIISSNCNGGVVCSDLGVRFNSPFVNLFVYPDDFLKILSNLSFYMNCELVELIQDEFDYPVGILNDEIKIYFMHYNCFAEAKEKWDLRRRRINYDNLFVIMTDRDGCTEEHIKQFDALPYTHKVIFTAKPYEEYSSVVQCEEYSNSDCVGILTLWRNLRGERLYDKYFDFVSWLNG